jgi:hypothetical protein
VRENVGRGGEEAAIYKVLGGAGNPAMLFHQQCHRGMPPSLDLVARLTNCEQMMQRGRGTRTILRAVWESLRGGVGQVVHLDRPSEEPL